LRAEHLLGERDDLVELEVVVVRPTTLQKLVDLRARWGSGYQQECEELAHSATRIFCRICGSIH